MHVIIRAHMKNRTLSNLAVFSLGLSLLSGFSLLNAAKEARADNVVAPSYSSLPTTIKLKDTTAENIRSYYSALDDLSPAERTGNKLLEHLKPILKNGMKYYSYDNVWKIYEITDRDWELSPAGDDTYNGTTYNAQTETYTTYKYGESTSKPGNDPYVHTLYRDRTNEDARIKEWGAHTGNNATNREHVWCQSRGFKGRGNDAASGPAGTDVHHLMSGDCKVNTEHHNDKPYGNVDKTKTYKDAGSVYTWLSGNLAGRPIKTSPNDQVTEVFEPRDEDKGDIARACFYMVARYNNLAGEVGVISDYEPNLALADYATGAGSAEYSTDTQPVYMGIMSDLLEWNHLDPVDEYEIHRNNLIYENYQHNRNPFVDFPQWADYIWGDSKGKKAAVPALEQLNTFTTADADLVGGFANQFAAEKTKASLRFSYERETSMGDGSATWTASSIGDSEIIYNDGYSSSLGKGITFSAGNPSGATANNTTKFTGTTLNVYKNAPMTISISEGYLKRVSFTITSSGTSTSSAGKFVYSKTNVSSGATSGSGGNLIVTLSEEETRLTVTQTDNSTYLTSITVECYYPVSTYSNFANAEVQFGYNMEIPGNANVSSAGIFVTDDPTYFATTALDEGFAPTDPDDLDNYVAASKHSYTSKNALLATSWTVGVEVSSSQYSLVLYAAAYAFINGQVTFAKTSSYSLATLLNAYSEMYQLSEEQTAIVAAFKSEINQ